MASKKLRQGSAMAKLELFKAYGSEPSWDGVELTDPDYKSKLTIALNWANSAFDAKTLKEIAVNYFQESPEYAWIGELPAEYVTAIGKQAWLRSNAAPTSEESDSYFSEQLKILRERYENSAAVKAKKLEIEIAKAEEERKLTPEQQAVVEYTELFSLLDNLILSGSFSPDEAYEIVRSKQPSVIALKLLEDHYSENVEEIDEADAKVKLKGAVKQYTYNLRTCSAHIVAQLAKMLGNIKAEKKLRKVTKTRKKKIKPANMQIKNLQFKEKDTKLKLVSIPPTAIINAETLITFNTKTRKIAIFYARNTDGLSVKGTTILNYDEQKSTQKTLRKPEEMIQHLIGTSLKRFEKVYADINAVDSKPKGRINSDVLLLKTFKIK